MKAIVCTELGPPSSLKYMDVADPTPGPKEVLVETRACAVNFPDSLIIQGKYQFRPELPFSPGSDISGRVIAVGEQVSQYKPGDEVFGVTQHGGMAEKVVVHHKMLFPKPPGLPHEIAASFLYAYGTSLHALKDRAQLQDSETVVILGAAGGVGLAAVDIAKKLGAKVIACASTTEKLDLCKTYGADAVINYQEEDLKAQIKALTNGKGADVIYDPVGGSYTEPAFRGMAWKGRYLVVGFAAGDIPALPLNLPLLKGAALTGVFWGRFTQEEPQLSMANGLQIMQWMQEGQIKPHIHKTFSLEQAPAAIEELMARKVKGKVVVKIS